MKYFFSIVLVSWFIWGCTGQANPLSLNSAAISAPVIEVPALSATKLMQYNAAVSGFVDSVLGKYPFNGSILVAKSGEVVYEKYSGFRNPAVRRDSITASTPFHLASVSKTFTAMAILQLQEEGRIDIQAPVSTYLPRFPLPGVTVKSLLNHRSGIPNYVHYMDVLGWDRSKQMTNEDVLEFIINRRKDIQIGAADRRFMYSNTNYVLLALIVERVSGQPFPEYMRQRFFEPLEMNDTYVFTMADSSRHLESYFSNGRQYAFDFLDCVYGDKNIYSTARDMLKWDRALCAGALFSQATLDSAFKAYSFEKPGVHNYGLGWRMYLLDSGKQFVYHNGWWHGNRTAFYRLPDDDVVIMAFTNNDSRKVYSCQGIANVFGDYFSTL